MAKLSVVVPFFNVEAYIGAALESIAQQTLHDLEVIMVDDGSADGSAVIAKSFATRDPRFRLVQQRNQGPGPARNAGVRHASGPYLAFADGDDLLDRHAYELLAGSLEKSGSDMACGGVRRLLPTGVTASYLHEEPFRETVRQTHVSRRPILLKDRTVWNKVFRRSFWDAHGMAFKAGLYEDVPVALRAHVLASSVDVLRDVVYYWRARGAGALSTTQRAREIGNIEDRMASVREVGGFLATFAPRLKPVYDQSVLNSDIAILLRAYELAVPAERTRLAELGTGYLRTVGEPVYREVPVARRLPPYLLREEKFAELLEVLRYWRRGDHLDAAVVGGGRVPGERRRRGRAQRRYACYPYFHDPAVGVPDEVYDVTDEMTLNARLDAVNWRQGRLRIEGHAYIRRLSGATPTETTIRVRLHNRRARRTIRLKVQRLPRPDATARSGQAAVCYDWSGFAVEINPRRLAVAPGIWRGANWELRIEVRAQGMRREGPVTSVAPGSAQWPEGRWLARRVWIQPAAEHDGRFLIRGRVVDAFVTGSRPDGDALRVEGWSRLALAAGAALVISPRTGAGSVVRVPVVAAGAGDRPGTACFRALLPAARLASPGPQANAIDQALHVHDEWTWDVFLESGNGATPVRLTAAPGAVGARARAGRREITAFVTHFGYLSMLARTVRPVVTRLEWAEGERLILHGDYTDAPSRPAEVMLRHRDSGETHAVALRWDGTTFGAELRPGAMRGMAGELPLESGNWSLLARACDGTEVTVAAARSLLPHLPGYHRAGTHEAEAQPYRTDALRLNMRPAFAEDERGRYARCRLEKHYYPQATAGALREMAVFDSFGGQHCSCNPQAIYTELRRTHPEIECVWATRDGQFRVPGGDRAVFVGGKDHFQALATARFVVFNDSLPPWFRKRDGQLCVQTWHGTPLKRIGLDIETPQFPTGLVYSDVLRHEVASWDLLLSPNAFSTPIFRRAFGFDGRIMESGYPRNDPLHQPGREQRAAAVRRRLHLPEGKRVVLYAPTWRDDAFHDGRYRFDMQLDLGTASQALGSDHVLLLRLHTKVRAAQPIGEAGVLDVTSYPDITDLFLISDVLITDYSSVMFDFAGTGRPMLFFVYDLERYRDRLRGFYFDFEAEAPGPLLHSGDEVISALRDIDAVAVRWQRAYEAFAATYCALDDGHAAARVVAEILP